MIKRHTAGKLASSRWPFEWEGISWLAAGGDALILLVFAAIGRASHHDGGGAVVGIIGTALPFLLGWFLAALLLGTLSRSTFAGVQPALLRTAASWLFGLLIALAVRSMLEGHLPPLTFVVVALSFNLVLLESWHLVLVFTVRRVSRLRTRLAAR